MASLACVNTPESPSFLPSSTTGGKQPSATTKPRFLQFFTRRKSGYTDSNSNVPTTNQGRTESPAPSVLNPCMTIGVRPSIGFRSRSENAGLRKGRPFTGSQKRKKEIINTFDSPSLAQAYSQALLHADLAVPLLISEHHSSRPTTPRIKNIGSLDQRSRNLDKHPPHTRTVSNHPLPMFEQKLILVVEGGHILQYNSDGSGDRLPEKTLKLSKEAVAFASDAIPGRPWVLQISERGTSMAAVHSNTLKPSKSMISLRTTEPKHKPETLSLIFADPEDLYTWLFTIRKEIQTLGGMANRPDTRGIDILTKECAHPLAQSSTSERPQLQRFSKSFSAFPLSTSRDIMETPHPPRLQTPAMERSFSAQSITSSSMTSTSLDGLRDSTMSESYCSTVATSHSSATSMSPAKDGSSIVLASPEKRLNSLGVKTSPLTDPVLTRMKSLNKPKQSIQERRNLSMSLQQNQRIQAIQHKTLPELPHQDVVTDPESQHTHNYRKSTLQNKPASSLASESVEDTATYGVRLPVDNNSTAHSHQKSFDKQEGEGTSQNEFPKEKAKYSLWPTAPATAPMDALRDNVRSTPSPQDTTMLGADGTHRKTRSRTLTLNIPLNRSPGLLSPADFEKAERSPAVTDAMIALNFGAYSTKAIPSPVSHIRVPSLSDLDLDWTILKTASPAVSEHDSLSEGQGRKSLRLLPAKSMPNLNFDVNAVASSSLAGAPVVKAPAGPPPTGPLPAIPNETESRPSSVVKRLSQNSNSSNTSRRRQTNSPGTGSRSHSQTVRSRQSSQDHDLTKPQSVCSSQVEASRAAHSGSSQRDSGFGGQILDQFPSASTSTLTNIHIRVNSEIKAIATPLPAVPSNLSPPPVHPQRRSSRKTAAVDVPFGKTNSSTAEPPKRTSNRYTNNP